jgi:hypothetical protein
LFDNEQIAISRWPLMMQNVKNNLENINIFLRKIKCQKSILLSHQLFEPLRKKMEDTIVLFDQKVSAPLVNFTNETSEIFKIRGFAYFKVCANSLEDIVSFAKKISERIFDVNLKEFLDAKKKL